jgi:hypothetical protein
MSLLDRSAVVVIRKLPFFEWVRDGDPENQRSIEEISIAESIDPTVYLVPAYWNEDDQDQIVRHFFDLIFESELEVFYPNREIWPEISWENFVEWFDVQFLAPVIDLVDAPLVAEEDAEPVN